MSEASSVCVLVCLRLSRSVCLCLSESLSVSFLFEISFHPSKALQSVFLLLLSHTGLSDPSISFYQPLFLDNSEPART